MGNETSAHLGRDEWARSGATVVTAGRLAGQREEPRRKSANDAPEQRRLSHCAEPSSATAGVLSRHTSGTIEGFALRHDRHVVASPPSMMHDRAAIVMADAPPFSPPRLSRRASARSSNAGHDEHDDDEESPRQESLGTPQSIMLHTGSEVGLHRRGSGQSGRSLEMAHHAESPASASNEDEEVGSEDSWSDDDGFGAGLGNYLLGVSEASISSRRFASTVERDNRRIGFGFNSATSSHRKDPSFRTAQTSHPNSTGRNPRLSTSEIGDGGLGLTNSGDLHSAAPDGIMPLAHFGEPGSMLSRHGSVSNKNPSQGAHDAGGKRSAQASVVFNDSVLVSDAPLYQDILVGNPNHRSSLARRAHVRHSPSDGPLRHNCAVGGQTKGDFLLEPRDLHVLSLEPV